MPSDTGHLELSQTSQVKSTVLHKISLTPDTSHKFGSSQAPGFLSCWLQFKITHYPLRFGNSLEQLTELRKALYLTIIV